jgi:predicted HTH transcriptional regulator
MRKEGLKELLLQLIALPHETEWVEFKHNQTNPQEIGEYISALSNSCALHGKTRGYIIWGIQDITHSIIGTSFKPRKQKKGNQELESWLLGLLDPKIEVKIHEDEIDGHHIVIFEIQAAYARPVRFSGIEYIRVGSYKKKLQEFPEKERALWRIFDRLSFEKGIAKERLTADEVLSLIDYPNYFQLLQQALPDNKNAILHRLLSEDIIQTTSEKHYSISNVGAVLFARNLEDFGNLGRKALRIVVYQGDSRVKTIKEHKMDKGYAIGFKEAIEYVNELLPRNEEIGNVFRREVRMYPEIAVRELVANALIHQDFSVTGTGPMIEVFNNRMEITNPGIPLVQTDRFLDSPPKSRNEALASFMRRIGICEERGSGVDKVVFETELYQLPAPLFEVTNEHTRAVLFARRELKAMDKEDRIRACYLHSCLKYVQRDYMTNTSLRTRFGIEEKNSAIASRLIKEAITAKRIKIHDKTASKKYMKYTPHWA